MKNTPKRAAAFENDPTAIVAQAFAELYPGVEYYAQLGEDIKDDDGEAALAVTVFPDDGSIPHIYVDPNFCARVVTELLAHELAHVVAGADAEHGHEWVEAFAAIHSKYREIVAREEAEAALKGDDNDA